MVSIGYGISPSDLTPPDPFLRSSTLAPGPHEMQLNCAKQTRTSKMDPGSDRTNHPSTLTGRQWVRTEINKQLQLYEV